MATVSVLDLKRRRGESNITNAKKKKSKQVFIQIKSVVTHVQNQSVTGIFFWGLQFGIFYSDKFKVITTSLRKTLNADPPSSCNK